MGVAKATVAAFGDDCFLTVTSKVSNLESFSFIVAIDTSADWNFDDKVFAAAASGAGARAVFTVFGGKNWGEAEV